MLIFRCTDCQEAIVAADDESPGQVFDILETHIVKCRLAQFTFKGTTDVGRQRADIIRSILQRERLTGKLWLH
jgi:hypothetical protein